MLLPGLKNARLAKGVTQEELSSNSGVHRDTIQKIETNQRPARPGTLRKLAEALGVEMEELTKDPKEEKVEGTKTKEKVEVDVRWDTEQGIRGETLRFRGEEIDYYEDSSSSYLYTLYECPGGYRVYVESGGIDAPAYLHPQRPNHFTGDLEYPTYSVEELVEEFPVFGEAVGVYRVRDLD